MFYILHTVAILLLSGFSFWAGYYVSSHKEAIISTIKEIKW
jgi:hypothetical protein